MVGMSTAEGTPFLWMQVIRKLTRGTNLIMPPWVAACKALTSRDGSKD